MYACGGGSRSSPVVGSISVMLSSSASGIRISAPLTVLMTSTGVLLGIDAH
jgi:hypothetical protein